MTDPRPYNPLSVDELGRNAARALMGYPPSPFPPAESFDGAGVYTIHYEGDFPAYKGMSAQAPIYVGKAELPGKRLGRTTLSHSPPVLHRRLLEHAETIRYADSLALSDFRCRWLSLDPVWIGLTEQVLIAEYRPVWNVVVDGFGNHDPGSGRRNQRRSSWDTLHPGRPWAALLRDNARSATAIMEAIAAHSAE